MPLGVLASLGQPGRAAGVVERGESVEVSCGLGQRLRVDRLGPTDHLDPVDGGQWVPLSPENHHSAHLGLGGDAAESVRQGGAGHDHLGTGITELMAELGVLEHRIDRDVHASRPQGPEESHDELGHVTEVNAHALPG